MMVSVEIWDNEMRVKLQSPWRKRVVLTRKLEFGKQTLR